MVLLSSSTVSVVLSSGVVCLFTFLLFLSGYVLQQQTVRSLQQALQAPLEERANFFRPNSVSPVQYEDQPPVENDSIAGVLLPLDAQKPVADDQQSNIVQVVLSEGVNTDTKSEKLEPSPQELWHAHVDEMALSLNMETGKITAVPSNSPLKDAIQQQQSKSDSTYEAHRQRLAYILPLPEPRSVCSAILFTKWHREFSALTTPPTIIFLYPSDWETSRKDAHLEAMELLRQSEHTYHILYHPVPISKVWTGIDIESQLLSELARVPWSYDRALYLRAPGMALDISSLDRVLSTSDTKKYWSKLRQNSRSSRSQAALHPDVLMFQHGRGLMTPERDLKKLTATASIGSHANNHVAEIESEALSKEAAYVIFNEQELEHRRGERVAYRGLFERFERDRQSICSGTGLLVPGE